MDGTLVTGITDEDAQIEPSSCIHCGRLFQEGDSITLRSDGSIKQCQHWNLVYRQQPVREESMLFTTATISRAVRVAKVVGIGFLNLPTSRGDVKAFHGDHVVQLDYTRALRVGETVESVLKSGGVVDPVTQFVTKSHSIVLPEDAAKALGIFLNETVEETQARQEAEAQAKKEADEAAAAAKALAESEAKTDKK